MDVRIILYAHPDQQDRLLIHEEMPYKPGWGSPVAGVEFYDLPVEEYRVITGTMHNTRISNQTHYRNMNFKALYDLVPPGMTATKARTILCDFREAELKVLAEVTTDKLMADMDRLTREALVMLDTESVWVKVPSLISLLDLECNY